MKKFDSNNPKIAIFDVCGTITKTNNTTDFISFVLKESRLKHFLFKLIYTFFFLLSTLRLNKLFKEDIARIVFIKFLKNYSYNEIKLKAKEYVNLLYKKDLINNNILDIIKKEKYDKDKIILISASIDPPIIEIAKKLGIKEFFSSKLEIIDGKYTGKLKLDLLGKKELILKRKLKKINFLNSSFYSDNIEDLTIMKIIPDSRVIINSPEKLKSWKKILKYDCIKTEFIINYNDEKEKSFSKNDVNSIDKHNSFFIYFPTLYYILSRFHRVGVIELFLKNILPLSVFIYFFSAEINSLAQSFGLVFLSFFLFFTFYEIGGLINDLYALKVKGKDKTTSRIKKGTKINFKLFLLIRIVVISLTLIYLKIQNYHPLLYISFMSICLLFYFLHTIADKKFKILTFTSLKIFRTLIPLLIFIDFINLKEFFVVFFINDAPERIYSHLSKKYSFNVISTPQRFFIKLGLILLGILIYSITKDIIYILLPTYLLIIDCLIYFLKTLLKDKI